MTKRTAQGSAAHERLGSLLDFCRSCGVTASGPMCDSCGVPLAGPRPLAQIGSLGAQADYRRGLKTVEGVVVGGNAHIYRVVERDGDVCEVVTSKVKSLKQSLRDGEWTFCGAILAASVRTACPDAQSEALRRVAVQEADDVETRRGLLVDALRMGQDELAASLGFGATELTWTTAALYAARADVAWVHRACEMLLDLPETGYPARLGIWFRAAVNTELPKHLVDRIREAAQSLHYGPPELDVAVEMLLEVLDPGRDKAALARRVRDQHDGRIPRAWLGESRSPAARLVLARHHKSESVDIGILDAVPRSILDDLIDQGALSANSLEPGDGMAWDPYVGARLDPSRLSDAELADVGHHLERARRAFEEKRPCPGDVPAEVTEQYRRWTALQGETPDADGLLAALEATGIAGAEGTVAAFLEGDCPLPPDAAIADPLVALQLARLSPTVPEAEPSALASHHRDFVGLCYAVLAREALRDWNWTKARETAQEGLRFARHEQLRDELLNLMACALWQLDQDEPAILALEAALEGDYTEALQANVAVVASSLASEKAAEHLARLVVEAPNIQLRLSAARRAVEIWGFSDEPWAQEDDLPDDLAEALRSLIAEDIPRDDFRLIIRLLADHDSDWLIGADRLSGSPLENSPEARVFMGRARGFSEFLEALSETLRADAPNWAVSLRDEAVAAALQVVIVEDPPIPAVMFGAALLEVDLQIPGDDLAVLRAFVARGIAMQIDPSEGEPADKFLKWLEAAAADLESMPPEVQDRARPAIELGFRALTAAYLEARWRQLQEAAQMHDAIGERLWGVPRRRIDFDMVRQAVAPINEFCRDTYNLMMRLRQHADAEALTYIDELMKASTELANSAARMST